MNPKTCCHPGRKTGPFILVWFIAFGLVAGLSAQVERVEPPFWWTGMRDSSLQLMIHGTDISQSEISLSFPGVEVKNVHRPVNRDYLFVDLVISPSAKAGSFDLRLTEGRKKYTVGYELKQREPGSANREGFNASDVIYLLMPDRFANGDTSNDEVPGMLQGLNMNDIYGRHGGDLKGISDHLQYIKNMGFTALWLNPVLENNQKTESYHGYAITDFYRVDPRLGTNEQYANLSNELNSRGIKLIMDMVFNHCGSEHWWMKDLPDSTWINDYPNFFLTSHIHIANEDPYASVYDVDRLTRGWFVPTMPDLNERNPFLAKYLIQNSIWWIEYAGLAGIRMDTYPYNDKEMMAEWNRRVLKEYPRFNNVGEEWDTNPSVVSYWQRGQVTREGFKPDLPSLMDFPNQSALVKGLNEPDSFELGLRRLYDVLAQDFLYPDPDNLVIFADNHDMARFFMQVKKDTGLFNLGMAYILTMRGIPQIFYGTEILMTHPGTNQHGNIRKDFPGGWHGDTVNAFTGQGLGPGQLAMQKKLMKLINWRKSSKVIHSGKLLHYVPEGGIYVYFRYNDSGRVMVILNKNTDLKRLDLGRYGQGINGSRRGQDVLTGKSYDLTGPLDLPPRTPLILELN